MPKPTPLQPISKRLEHVRKQSGERSLRAFWERVRDGAKTPVSYEAVRNYHYDREPPVGYLADVARVFGYRLEWLATGELPQRPPIRIADTTGERLLDRHVELSGLTGVTRLLFDDVLRRYLAAAPDPEPGGDPALNAGVRILALIQLPLELWGFRHEDDLNERELNVFYGIMLHALSLVLPAPGEGDSADAWGVLYATGITPDYLPNRREIMGEQLRTLTAEAADADQAGRAVDEVLTERREELIAMAETTSEPELLAYVRKLAQRKLETAAKATTTEDA